MFSIGTAGGLTIELMALKLLRIVFAQRDNICKNVNPIQL